MFKLKRVWRAIAIGGDTPVGRVLVVAEVPLGDDLDGLVSLHIYRRSSSIALVVKFGSCSHLKVVHFFPCGLAIVRERALLPGVEGDEHFLGDF